MAFKMVTQSEKDAGRIAGNAGAHADLIATDLTARWRSQIPEDQKYVDIHQAQLCVRHDLHKWRKEIAEIEDRHLGRLETEILSRAERDGTIPQLRGQLVGIQSLFEGNFGAGTSTKVFGPQITSIPLDPFPLRRVGYRAFRRLTRPDFVLPPSQLGGVEVVPLDLAKSFEDPLTRLDLVLVELEDTLPISNRTLEEKIRTLAGLRQAVGVAARFLEALYHLAGHEEIAQRVRLSSHRSRLIGPPTDDTTEEPPTDPTSGDEQPPPDGAPLATTTSATAPTTNDESRTAEAA